jgi:archaellum component FlaD/FlaE
MKILLSLSVLLSFSLFANQPEQKIDILEKVIGQTCSSLKQKEIEQPKGCKMSENNCTERKAKGCKSSDESCCPAKKQKACKMSENNCTEKKAKGCKISNESRCPEKKQKACKYMDKNCSKK